MVNNVDISIQMLRQLQSMIYDHSLSRNDLFKHTEGVINQMHLASIEINTNYENISQKLTENLNSRNS